MLVTICKSKIHRATVTEANLHYEGSLTVDQDLMDAAGMIPYEKVAVVNINNGQRFETYLIKGERGSGVICMNGAAARLGQVGDLVIIITYAQFDSETLDPAYEPTFVHVNEKNKINRITGGVSHGTLSQFA
jgi:aspartate 1-decarboxylase